MSKTAGTYSESCAHICTRSVCLHCGQASGICRIQYIVVIKVKGVVVYPSRRAM